MDNLELNEYLNIIENSTEINNTIKEFFFNLIEQYNKKVKEREKLEQQTNQIQENTINQMKNKEYDIILTQNYIKTLKELRIYIKDLRYQEKDLLNTIKDLQEAIISSPQVSSKVITDRNDVILKKEQLELNKKKLNENTVSVNVSGNESIASLLEISNKIIDEIFSKKGDKNVNDKLN